LTEHFRLTGGLTCLDGHKRASNDDVLKDRLSSVHRQDVSPPAAAGPPWNLYGTLDPWQYFYGTLNDVPGNFPNTNELGNHGGVKRTDCPIVLVSGSRSAGYASHARAAHKLAQGRM
jgi:hypothetical protein